MKISAVIIAKNEEAMLTDCLKTLKWADEIVVIDTGSIDKTTAIAKKYNARIVNYTAGKHFSDWRNKGLSEAKGEWIFYIDADERVTEKLSEEILSVVNTSSRMTNAYAVPRVNIVLGKELKHGGFYPDYQKRLFRKSSLIKWTGEVHEEPVYRGELGHLKNSLIHDKHETISEMVEKTNNWSMTEAKLMYQANHPPMTVFRFITAMFREFWHRMIVNKAFLDGKVGVVFAIYQVFSKFTSYAKLWEMQLNRK